MIILVLLLNCRKKNKVSRSCHKKSQSGLLRIIKEIPIKLDRSKEVQAHNILIQTHMHPCMDLRCLSKIGKTSEDITQLFFPTEVLLLRWLREMLSGID